MKKNKQCLKEKKRQKISTQLTTAYIHTTSFDITTQFVHLATSLPYGRKAIVLLINFTCTLFCFLLMMYNITVFVFSIFVCLCVFLYLIQFSFFSVFSHSAQLGFTEKGQLAHPFGLSFVPIWSINYGILIEWIIFAFLFHCSYR